MGLGNEDVIATAQIAVEEIVHESGVAIMTMLRSSKLLPLLMQRVHMPQHRVQLSNSNVRLANIKWPMNCEFNVDNMIKRIREFVTVRWDLPLRNNDDDDDDLEIVCVNSCTLNEVILYHFKVTVSRTPNRGDRGVDIDGIFVKLPTAGLLTPIYFLAQHKLNKAHAMHYVDVTYIFAGTDKIHSVSSAARRKYKSTRQMPATFD